MSSIIIPKTEYAARRQKFLEQIEADAIAIFPAAPEQHRSADGYYPYHQNTDFYYLSGFVEPNAVIVLAPNHAQGPYIMFNRARDPSQEVWTGRRAGQEGVMRDYDVNQAYDIADLTKILPALLTGRRKLYFAFGRNQQFDKIIIDTINGLRAQVRAGVYLPQEIVNPETIIHEMRLRKSPNEIAVMREAARISIEGHKAAIQNCRPGLYEYSMEAELLYHFTKNGSHNPAYGSIVAAGANACCLHYHENCSELKSGELLLIDAGCEYEYYTSDITRTFPINGRFTAEQRAIYDLVLRVQKAALAVIKPGLPWNEVNDTTIRVATEGLVELGILKGNIDSLIEQNAQFQFYMHRSGHWLGLDTHDVGQYKVKGQWRPLEAGMTFTVEPGLYIAPGTPNVDSKWYGIGIRIEDDVLVTDTGVDVLTQALPKEADEIEAMMAK